MRVLVTGAAGFFGSWLVPAFAQAGHAVVPYDLANGQDVFDVDMLAAALDGCDAAVHLAAYPHFRESIPPQHFERRNILGTARVVQALQRAGVRRLVYTSSGAVYGFGPGRPLEGWVTPPIREDMLPARAQWDTLDAYSGSKRACEEWLACLAGMTVTVLRVNCIEPYHQGAAEQGAHWGWWCSQELAARAYLAALRRDEPGVLVVNVGEANPHLDRTRLEALLAGASA